MASIEDLPYSEENFKALKAAFIRLQADFMALRAELEELKNKPKKNSRNSSKPPSSEGFNKPSVNLRTKSGKKPGGQPGHKGSSLKIEGCPDRIVHYLPELGCGCGCGSDYRVTHSKTFYEIDIPVIKPVVSQHCLNAYQCERCGHRYEDKGFNGCKVQYGPGVKSLAVYLKDYQLVPYNRIVELFKDCFSLSLSQGSLSNFTALAQQNLSGFEAFLKESLQNSKVAHCDETGVRVKGKNYWVHVASNAAFTHYHLDESRGKAAIVQAGILPNSQGTLIHDRFAAYFNYGAAHGLCNAHLLRELNYLKEKGLGEWPQQLIDLLLKAKARAAQGQRVPKAYITKTKNRFKAIVRGQLKIFDQQLKNQPKTPGKPKRSEAHNLLTAFNKHHQAILAFLCDPDVPFDNNLAERDLRMVKTKQKVSGCFRSVAGGEAFATIRSYISTLKKQNMNILEGLSTAFKNPQLIINTFQVAE